MLSYFVSIDNFEEGDSVRSHDKYCYSHAGLIALSLVVEVMGSFLTKTVDENHHSRLSFLVKAENVAQKHFSSDEAESHKSITLSKSPLHKESPSVHATHQLDKNKQTLSKETNSSKIPYNKHNEL